MLATNAPRWNHRAVGPGWPSVGISIAVTVAAFVVAFAAMMPVPRWMAWPRVDADQPTVVRLEPPAPPAREPIPRARPAPRTTTPRPVSPSTLPTTVAPTTPSAPRLVSPITSTAPRDSSAGSSNGPVIPAGPVRPALRFPDNPTVGIPGAPVAPAGVTENGRFLDLPGVRDSIAAQKMALLQLWATRHATGPELAELQERQRLAKRLALRATTAGNAADVHVMTGEGLDGVGAVNGGRTSLSPLGGSIPLTLFSSGPTAAQRKKNEKLDAEYQLRLRRLQERASLLADARHLDSLRVDSLRRDSLARIPRRRVP
jgi:hypothetical protein